MEIIDLQSQDILKNLLKLLPLFFIHIQYSILTFISKIKDLTVKYLSIMFRSIKSTCIRINKLTLTFNFNSHKRSTIIIIKITYL